MLRSALLLASLLLCGHPGSAYVHLMLGHTTPNMHVTVYSRFGRLLENATTGPGFHLVNRLTTSCDDVQTTPQVDRVSAACVTRDGIALRFEGIEVTNELPEQHVESVFARYGAEYDKITIHGNVAFHMQQMCANMTAEEVYVDKFDQLDERMHAMLAAAQQAQYDPGCERDCAVVQPPTGIRILRVKVVRPQVTNSRITEYLRARAEHAAATKAHASAQAAILQQNKRTLAQLQGELQRQEAEVRARLAREKDENEARVERQLAAKRAEEQLQRMDLAMRRADAETEANVTLIHAQAHAAALLSEGEASANVTVMEARANERLHTDAHVRIREAEAVTSGARCFYAGKGDVGKDDVPKTLLDGVDSLLRPG